MYIYKIYAYTLYEVYNRTKTISKDKNFIILTEN